MPKISAPISTSFPWETKLTPYQRFKRNPALSLAQYLYSHRPPLSPAPPPKGQPPIKIVCISDTHNTTPAVPDGDILLHAGDLTNNGTFTELQAQLDWLNSLPHAHKIVIAGNHDRLLDAAFVEKHASRFPPEPGTAFVDLRWGGITYLSDSSATVSVRGRDIAVFGSPWTPECGSFAFQHLPIRDVWKGKVPAGTDVLLTHGPPLGHLDQAGKGTEWLTRELWRTRPRLVVFGHIHEGRGMEEVGWGYEERVYDGVGWGEKGLGSVLGMAIVLGLFNVWFWVTRRRRIGSTTLINAAIVAGRGNLESRPATVTEM